MGDKVLSYDTKFWPNLALNPICHINAYICANARTSALKNLTFPNFEFGIGHYAFYPMKLSRFAEKKYSSSEIPKFHKGGPLQTIQGGHPDHSYHLTTWPPDHLTTCHLTFWPPDHPDQNLHCLLGLVYAYNGSHGNALKNYSGLFPLIGICFSFPVCPNLNVLKEAPPYLRQAVIFKDNNRILLRYCRPLYSTFYRTSLGFFHQSVFSLTNYFRFWSFPFVQVLLTAQLLNNKV